MLERFYYRAVFGEGGGFQSFAKFVHILVMAAVDLEFLREYGAQPRDFRGFRFVHDTRERRVRAQTEVCTALLN